MRQRNYAATRDRHVSLLPAVRIVLPLFICRSNGSERVVCIGLNFPVDGLNTVDNDTTDTTDFCPRRLVTDLLRGNWCNGFWPSDKGAPAGNGGAEQTQANRAHNHRHA